MGTTTITTTRMSTLGTTTITTRKMNTLDTTTMKYHHAHAVHAPISCVFDWILCSRVLVLFLHCHPTAAFRTCSPHSDANTHWTTQEDQDTVLTLLIVSVFATGGATALGLSVFFFERIVKAVTPGMLLCFRAGTAGAMISLAVSLIKHAAPLLPVLCSLTPFKPLTINRMFCQITHILPESSHQLEGVTDFPLGATLMVVGLVITYAVNAVFGGTAHDHVQNLNLTPLATMSNDVGQHPVYIATNVTVTPSPPTVHSNTAPLFEVGDSANARCRAPLGRWDVKAETGPDKSEIASKRSSIESIEFGCVTHCVVMGLALGLQRELSNVRNALENHTQVVSLLNVPRRNDVRFLRQSLLMRISVGDHLVGCLHPAPAHRSRLPQPPHCKLAKAQ